VFNLNPEMYKFNIHSVLFLSYSSITC
jgi:hypothetical protein